MIKKTGCLIVVLILAIPISWLFISNDNGDSHDKNYSEPQLPEGKPAPSNSVTIDNSEKLINEIYDLAKQGKIRDTSVTAGVTLIQEVYKSLGKPKKETKASTGYYGMYPSYNITIGYQNHLVFDVRSYNIGEAAVRSVKAGSDIILVAHDYNKIVSTIAALKKAVEQGEITEERVNESVRRIVQLKQKYALPFKKVEKVNIKQLNQSIKKVLNEYQ